MNLTQLLNTVHIPVFGSHSFSTTNQQDTQHSIAGVLNILLVLASLALLLVCVMIFNTVTMLLTEQMKVIGTMKALGGTRRQIVSSYLVSIGLYALVGTALGLGLGLLLFSHVTSIVANQVQIDLPPVFQRLSAQIQSLPNVARITQPASRAFVMTAPGELEIDGLPSPSVYQPQLLSGRWLTAQDSNVLVLSDIAAQRQHVKLGDYVTFHLELPQAQQVSWKIVGIVHELARASISTSHDLRLGMAFTTLANLHTLANLPPDDSPGIWIFAHDRSPQALQRLRGQILTIFS